MQKFELGDVTCWLFFCSVVVSSLSSCGGWKNWDFPLVQGVSLFQSTQFSRLDYRKHSRSREAHWIPVAILQPFHFPLLFLISPTQHFAKQKEPPFFFSPSCKLREFHSNRRYLSCSCVLFESEEQMNARILQTTQMVCLYLYSWFNWKQEVCLQELDFVSIRITFVC